MIFKSIYNKIQSNTLYLFLARIIMILIISSFIWVVAIYFYHEDKISKDIIKTINQEINRYSKLILNIDFDTKDDNYKYLVENIKNDSLKNDIIWLEIYDSNKNQLIEMKNQELLGIIKFGIDYHLVSESIKYITIPISQNMIYIYFQDKLKINNQYYYINIIKKLDKKSVSLMKKDIFGTLIIVLTTICIIFLSIFPIIISQYNRLKDKKDELLKSNINTIISLGNAVAKRDSDTNEHNYRVTYYSIKMAQELNLTKEQMQSLIKGAFLHDVGKIGISDNILLKPAKLTDEEFDIMKTHVMHGVDIIKDDVWLEDAKKVILNHHEKVDGSGYPNGLKKDEIPIEARIFSIADVFDALTSQRPYKEPFGLEKSFSIIQNDADTHFDKELVLVFEKIYQKMYIDMHNKKHKELKEILFENIKEYFNI